MGMDDLTAIRPIAVSILFSSTIFPETKFVCPMNPATKLVLGE